MSIIFITTNEVFRVSLLSEVYMRRGHPSNSRWISALVAVTIVFNAFMIGLEVG